VQGLAVEIEEYEFVLRNAESSILYTIELVERGLRIQHAQIPWYKRWFCKPQPANTPRMALDRVRSMIELLESWKMECPDLERVVVPAWPDPMFVRWTELARDYKTPSSFPPREE